MDSVPMWQASSTWVSSCRDGAAATGVYAGMVASFLGFNPHPRFQSGVAGAWQGWKTGKKGPAARRLPATARHKKGARVACNGRKKTALAAVSAFLSRASKPGAAIERHGALCAQVGWGVKGWVDGVLCVQVVAPS